MKSLLRSLLLMQVLMLGWEYPPHISGGLGVACEGLSIGLAKLGHRINFVVPSLYGDEDAPHMRMCDSAGNVTEADHCDGKVRHHRIPSYLMPYLTASEYETKARCRHLSPTSSEANLNEHYGTDLFAEVDRFAATFAMWPEEYSFDVIHAHDWMTFPAAVAIAERSNKPLAIHVHSLEHDRAGKYGNQRIVAIERLGMRAADAIIAVSEYTKSVIVKVHGVDPERITVAHNGIYPKAATADPSISPGPKNVVLFVGRVTLQKGLEYFIRAAPIVKQHLPDTRFVVAGSGDMLGQAIELVHDLELSDDFIFTGFLKGADVDRAYASATVYVMPSVSEPFGLTALEATRAGTPCILSKQSGVSEVISGRLLFDFWDVERLADLVVNCLQSEELRNELVRTAGTEIEKLRWDATAVKISELYSLLV